MSDDMMAIPLKCQRCKHEWTYKGKNPWYTTCPICKTSVKVNRGDKGV